MNRQCGGGKLKYVLKFCILGTGHVISPMRNDDLHRTGTLEPNNSKTVRNRGLVTMENEQEMGYEESNGHVTDDFT